MKRYVLLCLSILLGLACALGQDCKYSVLEACMDGKESVAMILNVDVKDKKDLEKEAMFAAIKVLLFDGVPNTRFSRPMLKDGYKSSYSQHPSYFQVLFNETAPDYVSELEYLSKFKKSDNKTTKVRVTLKPLKLRRNLEGNGIIKTMGL